MESDFTRKQKPIDVVDLFEQTIDLGLLFGWSSIYCEP